MLQLNNWMIIVPLFPLASPVPSFGCRITKPFCRETSALSRSYLKRQADWLPDCPEWKRKKEKVLTFSSGFLLLWKREDATMEDFVYPESSFVTIETDIWDASPSRPALQILFLKKKEKKVHLNKMQANVWEGMTFVEPSVFGDSKEIWEGQEIYGLFLQCCPNRNGPLPSIHCYIYIYSTVPSILSAKMCVIPGSIAAQVLSPTLH